MGLARLSWKRPGTISSVARPDYIARLHAAKYDLRFCSGTEKPEMLDRYRDALDAAAKAAGASAALLEAAVARDFGDWMRQEKLPPLPKHS